MLNEKIIDTVEVLKDKIVVKYESGVIRNIKEKSVVAYMNNHKITNRYLVQTINAYMQNLKEYKRDKNKLTFNKFITILENNNNSYYDFKYTKINGQAGYTYALSKKMNMDIFKCFNNVIIGNRTCIIAPELTSNIIFIQGK